MIIRTALTALLLCVASTAFGGAADDANALIDRWATVFNANDAEAVVSLYSSDAVLLGTVSPTIAQGTEAIRAYFSRLPGSGTKVAFVDRRAIAISEELVALAGFYDFTGIRDGQPVPNPARFTMILVKQNGRWLFAHHHSSVRPKPPQ